MNIENVKTIASVIKLVEYNWDEELKNFQETYDVQVNPNDLKSMIRKAEQNNWTGHIFYNLMVIKNCKFYKK